MITIRKYPNRRLYDTSKSQYVNLETIKVLVMEHADFQVVDSKSGDDLTKSILLQIISEQEINDQQSLLTQSVLKQLIRFYGSDIQVFMREYIEQSIAFFLERHDVVQGAMQGFIDNSPMAIFNQFMDKNMSFWNSFAKPNSKPYSNPQASFSDSQTENKKGPEEQNDKPKQPNK